MTESRNRRSLLVMLGHVARRSLVAYTSLDPAEADWRSVAGRSACYIFQSFEWAALWCRTCADAEHTTPLIFSVRAEDGTPGLVLPLAVRTRFGCRILKFLGGAVSDYNAPLVDPAFASSMSDSAVGGLWRDVVATARCDVVSLARMPEKLADGSANPLLSGLQSRHSGNAYAAGPLPGSFEAFAAGRSRAYFADTRRKRRKLERLGPVALDIPQPGSEAAAIVETMLRQKRRRIAETNAYKMQEHDAHFYRALAGSPISNGRSHASCLRVGGEIVATHLGALHRNRFYWLMPGFEAGPWARYSVGRALLQALVEWCIAAGVETFDLTVGDEEYKRFWSDTRLRLFESTFATSRLGSAFLAARRLFGRRSEPPKQAAAAQD